MKVFDLQCFFGEDNGRELLGNPARVLLAQPPATVAPFTCVQTYLWQDDSLWQVRSFTEQGAPIRFCGHGALAAAFVLQTEKPTIEWPVTFSSASARWRATEPADQAASPVLEFDLPVVQACPVPGFLSDCLGEVAQGAATAGDEQGYLLVFLASEQALAQLQVDSVALVKATARALIVTAERAPGEAVFRYFAPQYGNPEDAATGSAAVQLAAWWYVTRAAPTLRLTQLSAAGGQMWTKAAASKVELSGRVAYLQLV